MTRHWIQLHKETNDAYPSPPPPPPPPQGAPPPSPPPPPPPPPPHEENMVFQHPFTMMVSGPTACGTRAPRVGALYARRMSHSIN